MDHTDAPRSPVDDTVAALRRERAVAILRTPERRAAARALEAAVRGGFRVLEVTFGTPNAVELIAAWSARGFLVGAGTVLRPDQAREATVGGRCPW